VTEEVTGIDLVREQLRVAAGEPLDITQDDVTFSGHAIEVRLYAEDPANGFLPAAGTVEAFEPAPAPAVRWDSGVEAGSVVGTQFDPMLAKVIAHAATRTEAAGRLALALEQLHLGGIVTNRHFLAATLRHPAFLAGATTTDFIERVVPEPTLRLEGAALERAAITAVMWMQGENRAGAGVWAGLPTGWRNARLPAERVVLAHGDHELTITYRAQRDGSFLVNDTTVVRVLRHNHRDVDIEIGGRRMTSRITRTGDDLHVQTPGGTAHLHVVPRFRPPVSSGPDGGLNAPMPGVVLHLRVAPGDTVATGQVLVVLEAMKMEHHIKAPADGRVAEIRVSEGQRVDNGALLLVIGTADDGAPA
jgi:propionyl-CoA carboxylase alpha chain